MKKLRLENDCLILVDAGREIAVSLPGSDVLDLLGELDDGEQVTYGDPPPSTHRCEDSWARVQRMRMALCSNDTDSYDVVLRELGSCVHCLRNALNNAAYRYAATSTMQAGSSKAAADAAAREIARQVMGCDE